MDACALRVRIEVTGRQSWALSRPGIIRPHSLPVRHVGAVVP